MLYASAVGIDLGTTNTGVAILADGNPKIIVNKQGQHLTPSLIYYNPNDLSCSFGTIADHQATSCHRNFCSDIKRIIGRSFYDIYVQEFIRKEEAKSHSLKIVRSENNEPKIQFECADKTLTSTKSPEDISADLLKYIKESVREKVGTDIKDAVISVPAYFSYAQRAATKRAAEKAGLNVLKLITEPVAAAIQYTFRNKQPDGNLLMFDLGGGTLDLSIISIKSGNYTVKTIEGDIFLGGSDFDEKIFNFLRVEVGRRYGNHYMNRETKRGLRFLHRLRKRANRIKEMLSTLNEYTMDLEIDDGSDACDFKFTKDAFEKLCTPLFQRIQDKVEQCLESAGMTAKDIDKVVLVGGSSRIPKVREILSNMFSHIELSNDLNEDQAVALGASIHAALLKNEISDNEKYFVTEVAPFTVGIQSKYNLMTEFIRKGASLPITASQILTTTDNNQTIVQFEIFEGERKNCDLNNRLGGFSINNLPPGRAGDVDFKVTFSLDENGVLSVTATELQTGIQNRLQIEMQKLTLCSRTVFVSREEENRMKIEDQTYEDFCKLRLRAETFCKQVLFDLGEANLKTGAIIEKECQYFLSVISSLDHKEIEQLEAEFLRVMKKINRFINGNDNSSECER